MATLSELRRERTRSRTLDVSPSLVLPRRVSSGPGSFKPGAGARRPETALKGAPRLRPRELHDRIAVVVDGGLLLT